MNKHLNNINTGEVIRINKISDNGIYYSIFENTIFADTNQFNISKRIDNNIYDIFILEANKTFFEIKQDAALINIASIETDYELNEDSQNWCIKSGSTNQNTLFRVTIPNAAYDDALAAKDDIQNFYNPLWQIINYGTNNINSKFSKITYNAIVLYLEELKETYEEPHRQILEMYENDGVVIEEKL